MIELTDFFGARGAVFRGTVIEHFGHPAGEYAAARSEAVLFDRSRAGRLRLRGRDSLDLLHRTTTADLKERRPGDVVGAVIQTETARILDHVSLLVLEDGLTVITTPDRAEADRAWIERTIIMDDVEVEDVAGSTGLVEVEGPRAGRALAGLGGDQVLKLEPNRHLQVNREGVRLWIARSDVRSRSSFLVLGGSADVSRAVEMMAGRGVTLAGEAVRECLRLEAGIPAVGRELTEETNPLEAGLEASMSFTKGCYTGQEVIARMITYKSVKRRLAGFLLSRPIEPPDPGSSFPVLKDGAPAGRLTSAAHSPGLGRPIGMGFLLTGQAEPGRSFTVAAGHESVEAESAALPFI